MTIHTSHPFADPDPDPSRRLRGRLGNSVTLWTAGDGASRAGLTVGSLMVALGEPPRVLALLDPDSDLLDEFVASRRAVVQLLKWEDRHLAEAFAGTAPAPGGPFRQAEFTQTPYGPRLASAEAWADVSFEMHQDRAGWSLLVTATLDHVVIGEEDTEPLMHRRGRFFTPPAPPSD